MMDHPRPILNGKMALDLFVTEQGFGVKMKGNGTVTPLQILWKFLIYCL